MFAFPAENDDGQLAITLASTAGQLLLAARATGLLTGKALGAAGDAVAHQWIAHVLASLRPDDGFLSEEGAADGARLGHRRVWIVDPVDGTREYSEGRADWAVHIALVVDGIPTCAAVALPGIDAVLSSARPAEPAAISSGPLRIAVSRSRPPVIAERVAELLDAELVPMGSAGWKAMAVLRGEVHAYLHAGGQYEWDSAAPVAVAAAGGLHASRLDGSALRYNNPDPWLPDLLVCRPERSAELLAAVATALEPAR
jgi:3'(2'), 5'-bisphosphate nucleotidase